VSCEAHGLVRDPIFTLKMTSIQREYIRNARKAIRIANDVKFNAAAYNAQVAWAESYWRNYLKSVQARNFNIQMDRLKELLVRKDTNGALRYLDDH